MDIRKLFILLCTAIITPSCTITRAIKYGNASVDDYTIFEQDSIHRGDYVTSFSEQSKPSSIDSLKLNVYRAKRDTLLHLTVRELMDYYDVPSAAIILQENNVIFEHYSGGWNRDSQSCIFSITKTITSMLCGVAIKDGYIKSVDDYATDYIPELKREDPNFSKLKIKHLLDMTAGLDFDENYSFNPFSKMAKLYMGNNSLKTLKSLKFSHKPGENFSYNSATTALLGLIIERATGKSYADYLSENIWKPLGMKNSALIGLDDKHHKIAKSYAGLTTNVRDLAKIGQLFMNNGYHNGKQIIDSTYIARCLSPNAAGIKGKAQGRYSYSWYWGFTDSYYTHNTFQSKSALQEYYKQHPEVYMISSTKCGESYKTIESHSRRYFDNIESLKEYYANQPNKKVFQIYQNRAGYYAILHNGGYWAFGLYGQVLYINPEKQFIGVFLGADRLKDFNIVFDHICSGDMSIM